MTLSPQQTEVLRCAARGMCRKRTADIMGIALPTVKCHLAAARNKMSARTTTQAVTAALMRGLI